MSVGGETASGGVSGKDRGVARSPSLTTAQTSPATGATTAGATTAGATTAGSTALGGSSGNKGQEKDEV